MKFIKKMFAPLNTKAAIYQHVFGKTDKGKVREINEDAVIVCPGKNLFIAADGMGGHNAGEVASKHSVNAVDEFFSKDLLNQIRGKKTKIKNALINSVQDAHRRISRMAKEKHEFRDMGCTIVVALIDGDWLHLCHVGDSRAYASNENGIKLLTTDHSYVMELVKAGKMTMEESRTVSIKNELTQALGASLSISPDYNLYKLQDEDKVLLCSDGLWDMLSDQQIHQILNQNKPVKTICNRLIKEANNAGGNDNIAVIVFHKKIQENS